VYVPRLLQAKSDIIHCLIHFQYLAYLVNAVMGTRSQVLLNLLAYVKKIEGTEYVATSTSERKGYYRRLHVTFEELSERVKAESVAVDQVG